VTGPLFVGIDSWIIQDGNYPDFRVGQVARFALEFYRFALTPAREGNPFAERLSVSRYEVHAQVIYLSPSAWVVDFGLRAYQHQPPPKGVRKGGWLAGELYVGIDPFFYFEELSALPDMPELRYDWRIRSILLETTPWLEQVDHAGRTVYSRDEPRTSFVEVAETNAWSDDEGRASYLLECERLR
jgi:hypothetical protein